MRKRHIALSDIRISQKAKKYVNMALNSNRLSYGPLTEKFERKFARAHKRKFAMVTNSGTSGLQVALHALKEINGWNNGDEVLVPAVTFIASSNVILHNNLTPVFVDVEPDYYCIDPKKIEQAITAKTKAIMPVHLFGQSCDMKSILKIAKKYNLKIIEDSCEAMFVDYEGKPIGSMGDVSVFSTYIAHILVTGVGGIVATNNESLATTIRSLMFHGRDNIYLKMEDDDTKNKVRLNSLIERRFQFIHVGYSYRNTEMEGALGLAEIERKYDIIKKRKQIGQALTESLKPFSKYFQLPQIRPHAEHIYMLYPIIITNDKIEKEDFLLYLETHGIETRLFFPLLSQPIYKKIFGDIDSQYLVAKRLVEKGFIIGSHPYLTKLDIKYIQEIFRSYLIKKGILKS
ncbi:MAG: DegT/DnrJ/EryC1/StrS family aminotransferase [Actinobacteria bacterium]|nr:DegT/DnrJ/EryC1/StrS family aminotransferase [Actinomycetota bacterium]